MTNPTDLVFAEPPALANNLGLGEPSPVRLWLDELRKYPNRSSIYTGTLKSPSSTAANINRGRGYGAKKGEFTACTRQNRLYVTYVGPDATPEPSEESRAIVASISQAASNLDPETRRLLAQAFAGA